MEWFEHLKELLGIGQQPKDLTFLQVSLRGIIVFLISIGIVRISEKRFLPHKTAFDAILFFMLASMLSRAINGSAPYFQTIGAAVVLVFLHRLLALAAFHSHAFGKLIKGNDELLIKDGHVMEDKLRRNNITDRDLMEELRLNGAITGPEQVREARYERSGEISVVKK